MQSSVVAPSTEIADDLMMFRFGLKQRWQTRRGLPGRERIIDWLSIDLDGVVYPKRERDNFGEDLGLLNYDVRWYLGDRLTLVSDGFVDFFTDGLRTISLGGVISRPSRGRLYLGWRSIEGPISSSVVRASSPSMAADTVS